MAAKFVLAVFVAFAAIAGLGMADDVLLSGQTLYTGQSLNWGGYYLTMQSDCNLVLYDNGRAIWASNTDGLGSGCRLTMQSDGNLVVYGNNNNAVWASGTARANGNYVLVLQQDGNVVIYGPDFWATGTNRYTVGGGITVAKPEHEDIKMVINN